MQTCSDQLVTLRGGMVASLTALRLLLSLEEQGYCIASVGEHLRVHPSQRLTATELDAVKAYRDELLALVRHCETIQ